MPQDFPFRLLQDMKRLFYCNAIDISYWETAVPSA